MLSDSYCEKISEDWLWREKELRKVDSRILKLRDDIDIKFGILVTYSHWEGHFKTCASELLGYICEGIKRKLFKWTDIRPEIRQRILFCSYRKSSIAGQTQETFISYLNALHDARYSNALDARDEIIMIDDNLYTLRAEAICRNLGVEHDWFSLKKIIIDERLIRHRNAIAHGAKRLKSGDLIDLSNPELIAALGEVRSLIRETRNRFSSSIINKSFL